VTSEALERARSGNGPTFIEAYTYRMGAHTTSDDPTKYRLADELEHWRLKDPIERVRAYLTRSGAADDAFFAEIEAEAADLAREDIGKLGGVFRVTEGLQKDFGEHRVIDSPLAESGIVGTAVGMALRGYRPVCEIQFDGFVYPAFDQIVTQVAKMHNRSRGR